MEKIIVKMEYVSSSVEGIATFETKQIDSLTFTAGVRLSKDLVYYVPRQWVHKEKLLRPFNGRTHSNKIFLFGVDPVTKEVKTMTSIAVNSLTGIFFGTTEEYPQGMKISFTINGKVHRAVSGTSMVSVFKNGGMTFQNVGSQVYVSRPISFVLEGRKEVWTSKLKNTGTAANPVWDMEVEDEYLKLARSMTNTFSETLSSYEPELTADILGESAFADFSKMIKDLPA